MQEQKYEMNSLEASENKESIVHFIKLVMWHWQEVQLTFGNVKPLHLMAGYITASIGCQSSSQLTVTEVQYYICIAGGILETFC